jgi:hypothetical protein
MWLYQQTESSVLGRGLFHGSFLNGLFTVNVRLFGVQWQTSESQTKMGEHLQPHSYDETSKSMVPTRWRNCPYGIH